MQCAVPAEGARQAVRAVSRLNREWEVEKIMNRRQYGGVLQYRVKWKNYNSHRNTWEPVENLTNSRKLIAAYEKCFKNKK